MQRLFVKLACIVAGTGLAVALVVIGCRQSGQQDFEQGTPSDSSSAITASLGVAPASQPAGPTQALASAESHATFDPAQPAKLPGVNVNPPPRDAIISRLFNLMEGMPGIGVLDIRLDKPTGQVYKAGNRDLEAAISLAARSYAFLTGDFQVTIRDIVQSGLWPYESFDEGEFDLGIVNGACLSLQGLGDGRYTEIDTQIGSAGWVTSVPLSEVLGTGCLVCQESELSIPLLPRVNQVLSAR